MSTELEARFMELEIKASYADDLLEQLNALVAKQQQQIDALVREVRGLREQSSASSGASLRDELPPHY
jgi:SlyX protein